MSVYNKGDIIRVELNPMQGRELQVNMKLCLVISPKKFNRLGLTIVAPITQVGNFARMRGFAIPLQGSGTITQGVILTNAIRSLDLNALKSSKIESVPQYILDEIIAMINAILED